MALSASVWLLVIGEILAQIGVDTYLVLSGALIAENGRLRHRKMFLSALNGIAPIVGGTIGLQLLLLTDQVRDGYFLLAGWTLCLAGGLLFLLQEERTVVHRELPFNIRRFLYPLKRPRLSSHLDLGVE